jgi:transposase
MSTPDPNPPLSWREGRRRRAWELYQQGWTQVRIAAALGVSQGAVSQWLTRASSNGPPALADRSRPGRPPALGADQLTRLVDLLRQGAEAHGFLGNVWTRRRVAQLIQAEFAISYHPTHVGRLLRQIDWSPQRPIVRATQRDEAAIAAWYHQRWPALKKSRGGKGELSSS